MTEQQGTCSDRAGRADENARGSEDTAMDRLYQGVGEVCVAASRLEGALAFIALVMNGWTDEKYRDVLKAGRALREFRALVPVLEACGLGSDPRQVVDDAKRLMDERNRVVHSAMMIELKLADEPFYQAWHARSDEMWDVDPAELHKLAEKLTQLASKVDDFGLAWEQRTGQPGTLTPSLIAEYMTENPASG